MRPYGSPGLVNWQHSYINKSRFWNTRSVPPVSPHTLGQWCRIPRSNAAAHFITKRTGAHKPPHQQPCLPPQTKLLSKLPAPWVPYAELLRLHNPVGIYYLFFPCVFSTLVAASMTTPITSPGSVIGTSLLFMSGSIVMRGAGCAVNDLWDRNLDPHVARTRLRPLARGAITPFQGLMCTGFSLLAGLGILLQFPSPCVLYGIPSLLLVASYPLAKRITYYPQFVLGLTFSWGSLMGFPALGLDIMSDLTILTTAGCLYAASVVWTILYDMVYAHLDINDDAGAGIKSIALKHEAKTKYILTGLAAGMVGLLAGAGVASGAGITFYITSCGGAMLTLGAMITRVKLKNSENIWWWFCNNCWMTGGIIGLGLAIDYGLNYTEDQSEESQLI
ncbi:unnamed protein product [Clonostachys byssicola]|uniref:4-hydroxybenzoate polyprenyltransferase, mitochondrial n=1 Tax=Clonostachys byssicola TaxID=160290 RepID=A0A9N9Y8I4_9HYPO|nr:unnamed protein product [Clonostachys byssicola]